MLRGANSCEARCTRAFQFKSISSHNGDMRLKQQIKIQLHRPTHHPACLVREGSPCCWRACHQTCLHQSAWRSAGPAKRAPAACRLQTGPPPAPHTRISSGMTRVQHTRHCHSPTSFICVLCWWLPKRMNSAQLADSVYLACGRGAIAAGKGLPLQVLQLLRLACGARPDAHGGPGLQSCNGFELNGWPCKATVIPAPKSSSEQHPTGLFFKTRDLLFGGLRQSYCMVGLLILRRLRTPDWCNTALGMYPLDDVQLSRAVRLSRAVLQSGGFDHAAAGGGAGRDRSQRLSSLCTLAWRLLQMHSPQVSTRCQSCGVCWRPMQRLQRRLPGLSRGICPGAFQAVPAGPQAEHCTTCTALPSWQEGSQTMSCRGGARLTGATGVPGWQRRLAWLCARSAGPIEAARCWLLSCGVSAPLEEAPAMALPPALDNRWPAAHKSWWSAGCMFMMFEGRRCRQGLVRTDSYPPWRCKSPLYMSGSSACTH